MTLKLPSLVIDDEAFAKMMLYIHRCRIEISGFAKVERKDSDLLVVKEPFILPQVCTPGSTEPTPESLEVFFDEFLSHEDVNPEEYVCWWHSHVHGDAYFSPVDTKTIEESFRLADYWVSIVANVHFEVSARIDVYRPERKALLYPSFEPPLSVEECREIVPRFEEKVKKDISEKVNQGVVRHNDDWRLSREDALRFGGRRKEDG